MLVGQTIGSGAYRFEIEAELGAGAMGMVYRARFYMDGKVVPVALKMVSLGLLGNESALARFEREANILKQLRHPNIVRLYASGQYRKMPFIAMEFIDGESLDRVLSRRGRMTWEEITAYGKQLCAALQHAHDKGIIHRDLKPSNIMITRDGVLKLTDFGIAKDIDVTALTAANSTIGTAAYMSPEQCRGERDLTPRSDLYSLGVVFFELLTGRKPFRAETTMDMFLKHVQEPPPRPSRLTVEVPPKLEALILQLMAKDKNDRPTDAAWVARMLEEIEEDALALRSAGEALLHSRNLDKPRHADGSRLTAEDREALRALRGKKRKKKPRDDRLWWEKPLFQATVAVMGLLVIVGVAAWALWPPSADKLYQAVKHASEPEQQRKAVEAYLKRFGQTEDDRTLEVAAIFRDLVVRERSRVLHNRFQRGMSQPLDNDDPDAYKLAWKALESEKSGNLSLAEQYWKQLLERFAEQAQLPFTLEEETLQKARWGWLAQRRLQLLQDVKKLAETLRKQVEEYREFERPFPTDPTQPETLALRAVRLELFGDREKAGRIWTQLYERTEKDEEQKSWYLLAGERKHRLTTASTPADPLKQRLNLIEGQLQKAQQLLAMLQPTDPAIKRKRADIRILCRDITDLYADEEEPAIKKLVEQARDLMNKLKD
jgi:serine/threonine protein kinase